MPKAPITNIIFGTMTLANRGYGARFMTLRPQTQCLRRLGIWPRPARHVLCLWRWNLRTDVG